MFFNVDLLPTGQPKYLKVPYTFCDKVVFFFRFDKNKTLARSILY